METDQPTQENPHEQMTSSDEQCESQIAGRSYECNFCKKGFSNAQALGGHMNIHRKDKAKLRQLSISNDIESQQYSLDSIPKNNINIASSYSPIPTNTTQLSSKEAKSSDDEEERSTILWPPWLLRKESDHDHAAKRDINTHVGEIQQLSLFVEKPTSKDHQKTGSSSTQVHVSNEKDLSSSQQGSSGSDQLVDLELRLGPERHLDSPTTRKFF